MHVKIFMTSIERFILWYSCVVDSCQTHSVEKRCVVYFFITQWVGEHSGLINNGGIIVEKHTRLCSVGRSICKKWSLSAKL